MSDALLKAELDAHDALLRACLDGSLSFEELLAAYGRFPISLGVAETGEGQENAMRRFRGRILFHVQVAGALSGLQAQEWELAGPDLGARVGLMRLRSLVARYPALETSLSEPQSAVNAGT